MSVKSGINAYRAEFVRLDAVALINVRASLDVARTIGAQCGFEFPEAAFVSSHRDDVICVRLAPDQWWLRSTDTREQSLFEMIKMASQEHVCAVTVVSDHFQGFEIQGDDADAVMAQAVAVDLRGLKEGGATRAKFARIGATIFVKIVSESYEVFVESSYADYVTAWLTEAGGCRNGAEEK